jgi:hypothetical protein
MILSSRARLALWVFYPARKFMNLVGRAKFMRIILRAHIVPKSESTRVRIQDQDS